MKGRHDRGSIDPVDTERTDTVRQPGQIVVTQYLGDAEASSVRITVEVRTGHTLGLDTMSLWWFSDGQSVVLQ